MLEAQAHVDLTWRYKDFETKVMKWTVLSPQEYCGLSTTILSDTRVVGLDKNT